MFTPILFPVDLEHTETVDKALALALEEVERSGAELTVMTVAPGVGMPLVASYFKQETLDKVMREVEGNLDSFVQQNIPAQYNPRTLVVKGNGHPANEILKTARQLNMDLIVISSHDSKLEPAILGSVSAKVVRHSHCSVLVVKK